MAERLVVDRGMVDAMVSQFSASGASPEVRAPDYGSASVSAGEELSRAGGSADELLMGREQLAQFLTAGAAETGRVDTDLARNLTGAVG